MSIRACPLMHYSPMQGPLLKVHNASHHVERLVMLFNHLKKIDHFYLNLENDPSDDSKEILQIRERGIFPANFSLGLGDVIHNLRSALDLLASDLAILNNKSPKGIYFPIAATKEDLEGQIKSKKFTRTSEDAQNLLYSIEAYGGGSNLLRSLHELDIIDKHQLIIPMASALFAQKISIITPEGGRSENVFCTYHAGSGWRFSKGTIIETEGIEPRLFFPHDMPSDIQGRNLFEILEDLLKLVSEVIMRFCELYPNLDLAISEAEVHV
jgi:hypothetical protein